MPQCTPTQYNNKEEENFLFWETKTLHNNDMNTNIDGVKHNKMFSY
jgi:hypothetical protein